MRSGTPSSAAMIMARVVLPSPGAPLISTWSGGRLRRSALCSTSESCSRTRAWPMNSSSRLGRSAASISCSSPSASGDTRSRSELIGTARRSPRDRPHAHRLPPDHHKSPADAHRRRPAGRQAVACQHGSSASPREPLIGRSAPAARPSAGAATCGVAPGGQLGLGLGRRPRRSPRRRPWPSSRDRPARSAPGPARGRRPPAPLSAALTASSGVPSRSLSSSTIRWAPFGPDAREPW